MPDGEASSNGGGSGAGSSSGNNSSDFVRKLYKMLEEPQYASVVRWGNDGTSFVVLENEKFTKHILPKHFKHSNFASFVRQLNKYDFHKVRQNDENGQSQYGPGAWEFVHPEFRADRKDNLDNIRRKAPAPRRAQTNDDQFTMAQAHQQAAELQDQLTKTKQEMQSMQEENMKSTRLLADQVGRLRKIVTRQSQALDELVTWHIQGLVDQRDGQAISSQDELPLHLRQTREIVDGLFRDLGNDVEKLNPLYDKYPATSEDDVNSESNGIGNAYGIVPPYGGMTPYDVRGSMVNGQRNGDRKKDIWGERKPCILLVEDEAIAAKIAQKRLQSFSCLYEYARDGPEAVRKVNNDPHKFDLILMDIKLPGFGGIEAAACIRVENHPRMPIIAMTASRRPDDMTTYLKTGMDDLLPKPFSGQVFEALLRKHLPHLLAKKDSSGDMQRSNANPYDRTVSANMGSINTNLGKFEQTPIQSPSGSMGWGHSPATANPLQTASPVNQNGMVNSTVNGGAVLHPNGMHSMSTGLPNGIGGGMTNGMGGISNGNTISSAVMGAMDPSMTSLGQSSYMAALSNGQISMAPMQRHFPSMSAGYGHMVDGGLDFGDERPEKRQRIYAPADMGYPT
ncbi:hypothetical protein MKZ38_008814 [Zalerion maritima]|uniref:Transcription factor n=1 Tax=Zalerion maritima TaxID=339359 RepID=A0AAD5RVX9_9PEZI|nr:hypothetical protein MKZ38_008814 [Zalerion maritima]